ncbi:MAG: FecR domain-containing protein [Bacteroidetes bacterium]|nr:FecR domain-containing protein [Bacteroidota bacterium]
MEDSLTYYTDLTSRYFAGEASSDEIQLLSSWVSENAGNRKIFEDYRKAWELVELSVLDQKVDTDADWKALEARMQAPVQVKETPVVRMPVNEAASGRTSGWWKIAASVLVILTAASLLYYYLSGPSTVILTADAGSLEQVLPDGSVITLNKGATLEYPSRFSGKTRPVKLTGEAYFNVAHDKSKPFIVKGSNVNVEVLGTMFNVNTKADDGKMSVVLTTGKIALYFTDRSADKIILNPGEKADVSQESHQILKSGNSDPNYLAWKTGQIVFENIPLGQIIRTLNTVYHTNIMLANQSLGNCRVTASFDHQSVTAVLNVIKTTLDLSVTQQGNFITLSGKPCN